MNMTNAKLIFTYVAMAVAAVAFVAAMMFGARMFSNATTPITVHEVEPGVKCAAMVTADGAAISCWKN